jgi:transposase
MKGRTMKIPKQQYPIEFKELAVTRVKDGLTAGAAAKELGLVEHTRRNWVKVAAAGTRNGAGATVGSHRSRGNCRDGAPRTCD